MIMYNCESFLPIIDKKSKIMILGSIPGIKSLEQQQYYAHPQNRFWKLMGKLCGCKNLLNMEYKNRIKILLNNNYALWDVIKSCSRKGSMDANIHNETPNDMHKLLKEYGNIQILCFNGNKAYTAFKKYFPDLLFKYKYHKLPSTSPANARYKPEDLYREWNFIK